MTQQARMKLHREHRRNMQTRDKPSQKQTSTTLRCKRRIRDKSSQKQTSETLHRNAHPGQVVAETSFKDSTLQKTHPGQHRRRNKLQRLRVAKRRIRDKSSQTQAPLTLNRKSASETVAKNASGTNRRINSLQRLRVAKRRIRDKSSQKQAARSTEGVFCLTPKRQRKIGRKPSPKYGGLLTKQQGLPIRKMQGTPNNQNKPKQASQKLFKTLGKTKN